LLAGTGLEPVNRVPNIAPEEIIFGISEVMQVLRRKIDKLAGTNVPVLLEGASGAGKEVIARYIHQNSPVHDGAFVKVSCAAIPGELTESELFGYHKGAFTGASNSKPGRIELAHQGTLYLDEIAELDPTRQAKLLQVLQDGRFCRLGDEEETKVDARVICATNRSLHAEILSGTFRQDLFYRINVFHICLPTLRERREDIPQIARFLLATTMLRFNQSRPALSDKVLQWMKSYSWPGNIRELENWVTRYVLLGAVDMPEVQDRPDRKNNVVELTENHATIPLKRITKDAMLEAERVLILKTLEDHRWNRRRAAEALKLSYRALIYKIRQAGLSTRRVAPKTNEPPPLAREIRRQRRYADSALRSEQAANSD
jgi:two-component system, NtrC family, response regulator AtoC